MVLHLFCIIDWIRQPCDLIAICNVCVEIQTCNKIVSQKLTINNSWYVLNINMDSMETNRNFMMRVWILNGRGKTKQNVKKISENKTSAIENGTDWKTNTYKSFHYWNSTKSIDFWYQCILCYTPSAKIYECNRIALYFRA